MNLIFDVIEPYALDLLVISLLSLVLHFAIKLGAKKLTKLIKINGLDWVKTNQIRVALIFGLPFSVIYAPVVEELLFRFPLILAFKEFDVISRNYVILGAVLFSLVHQFNSFLSLDHLITGAKRAGTLEGPEPIIEEKKEQSKPEKITSRTVSLIATLSLGYYTGYLAVTTHNIWAAVLAHSIWNLTAPFILSVVYVVSAILLDWIIYLIWLRVVSYPLLKILDFYYWAWSKTHGGATHVHKIYFGSRPKWVAAVFRIRLYHD